MLSHPTPYRLTPLYRERHLDGIDLAPDTSEELEAELRQPRRRHADWTYGLCWSGQERDC